MSNGSPYFQTHSHSKYSQIDGISNPSDMVHKAAMMGQPGFTLTDHGSMAGITQLYTACKREGILPFPGIETYLCDPSADDPTSGTTERFHVGLFALNTRGYNGLVRLSSLAHTRPRFSRYPRLLITDLAEFGQEYGKDVALTTGCFFGLVQQQIDQDNLEGAERTVKSYAQWFPNTFVELQNHNITHEEDGGGLTDAEMVATLYDIAQELGLPVLAGQDSHYLDSREKTAHELMKRMVYSSDKDNAFPGDSFHVASTEWVQAHYPPHIWDDVEDSCRWLINHNRVKIPALDSYKSHVPAMSRNPDRDLSNMVRRLLSTFLNRMDWSAAKRKKYVDRLDEELSVIRDVGQSNYFLLWKEFVDWCKEEAICIEARGSGNGSLVNFLLGITQVDPIKWNTMFERFMSRDRIKPPDIDMDVDGDRRMECLNWWKQRYGVVQIGNWSKLGQTDDGNDKGSVLVSYISYLRRKAEKMSHDHWFSHEEVMDSGKKKIVYKMDPKTKRPMTKGDVLAYGRGIFFRKYGHIQTIEDVRSVSEADYVGLRQLAKLDVYRSYGVHAAGLLLDSPDMPFVDWIPTMLVANTDTMVTQFDMDDLDLWGLMKNDILGQASLSVMRQCLEYIGRTDPTDFTWIPDNDRAACRILREGRTENGIFHFEGYTKSKGGKEMGIASTKDTIMASALYMPGAMDSGQKDLYLKNRRMGRNKNWGKMPHQAFIDVLSETYGAVIFQEQPIAILRLLGMSIENINILFKVVKDSGKGAMARNAGRMAEIRKEFDHICAKNGIDDIEHAWHLCTGFIAYGFNRAHATGYGLRSYRCAYLKAHFPKEFMAALLKVWAQRGNKDKEKAYSREARRLEIRLLPAHVNLSGPTWEIDPNGIRRGLVSIDGIGMGAAQEIASKAPYRSIDDLARRVNGRQVSGGKDWLAVDKTTGKQVRELTGKLAMLAAANAMDELHERGHERVTASGRLIRKTKV
jgi:DNA polymerase-3 subunit alpha